MSNNGQKYLQKQDIDFNFENPHQGNFISESPHEGNLFLKVRMKAIISESPHEGSIYHCLQSNSKRRTQCFQDMPEEGELDGHYQPLDG